jgi:uncharacterized membrane protein
MTIRKIGIFLSGLLLWVSSVARAAPPPDYVFTTVDVPGAQVTVVEGINDRGHVVGTSRIDIFDLESSGFLLADGVFSPISVPGARSTTPQGINKDGSIVGSVSTAGGQKGFLFEDGAFTVFDVPLSTGVCLTSAYTINNNGQIVGEYLDHCDIGNRQHGFLNDDRKFTSIDFPGALGTVANGINDRGHIVGFFYGDTPETAEPRGFLKKGRSFRAVDASFVGTYNTVLNGINNDGNMVGTFSSTVLGFGSFVYIDGQFIELEVPSASITVALAINKRGQIAGFYSDSKGTHGFIATPVKHRTPAVN